MQKPSKELPDVVKLVRANMPSPSHLGVCPDRHDRKKRHADVQIPDEEVSAEKRAEPVRVERHHEIERLQ